MADEPIKFSFNNNNKVYVEVKSDGTIEHGKKDKSKQLATIFEAIATLNGDSQKIDSPEEKRLVQMLRAIFRTGKSKNIDKEELEWVNGLGTNNVKDYIEKKYNELISQSKIDEKYLVAEEEPAAEEVDTKIQQAREEIIGKLAGRVQKVEGETVNGQQVYKETHGNRFVIFNENNGFCEVVKQEGKYVKKDGVAITPDDIAEDPDVAAKREAAKQEPSAVIKRNKELSSKVDTLVEELGDVTAQKGEYEVKEGDRLWNIAIKQLKGQEVTNPSTQQIINMIAQIKKLNPEMDINNLKIGQKIKLPGKSSSDGEVAVRTATDPANVMTDTVDEFEDLGLNNIKFVKGSEKLVANFKADYQKLSESIEDELEKDETVLMQEGFKALYKTYAEADDEEFACSVLASKLLNYADEEDIIKAINAHGAKFLDALSREFLNNKLDLSNNVKKGIMKRAIEVYQQAEGNPANMVYLNNIKTLLKQTSLDGEEMPDVAKLVTVPEGTKDKANVQKSFNEANKLLLLFATSTGELDITKGRDDKNNYTYYRANLDDQWVTMRKYDDGKIRIYVSYNADLDCIDKNGNKYDGPEVRYQFDGSIIKGSYGTNASGDDYEGNISNGIDKEKILALAEIIFGGGYPKKKEVNKQILESYFTMPAEGDKSGKPVFKATNMTPEEAESFCALLAENGEKELIEAVLATITLDNINQMQWFAKAEEIFSVKYSNLVRDMYANFIQDGSTAMQVLDIVQKGNCVPFDKIISKYGKNGKMINALVSKYDKDSVISTENRTALINNAFMTDGKIDLEKAKKHGADLKTIINFMVSHVKLSEDTDTTKQWNAMFECLDINSDVELWKMLYNKLDKNSVQKFRTLFIDKLKANITKENMQKAFEIYKKLGLDAQDILTGIKISDLDNDVKETCYQCFNTLLKTNNKFKYDTGIINNGWITKSEGTKYICGDQAYQQVGIDTYQFLPYDEEGFELGKSLYSHVVENFSSNSKTKEYLQQINDENVIYVIAEFNNDNKYGSIIEMLDDESGDLDCYEMRKYVTEPFERWARAHGKNPKLIDELHEYVNDNYNEGSDFSSGVAAEIDKKIKAIIDS